MRKYLTVIATLAALAVWSIALAEQDSTITIKEVRNPKKLQLWLETNAADAESRLTSGATTAEYLALINYDDAGTAYMSLQSDQAADAGDLGRWLMSDGSGMYYQTDITTKGTPATKLTLQRDGDITMSGGAVIDNATSATVLTLTETTIALAGNVTGSGTAAWTGVSTHTAQPIFNAGVDINDDFDLDQNGSDEYINLSQTAVTGEGGAGWIVINDDRTGATALTYDEATITMDSEGVYAIAVVDGAVAVESIIDTCTATTLNLGGDNANKVEIADSTIETEVQGTLDVHDDLTVTDDAVISGKLTVTETLEVSGVTTLATALGDELDTASATALLLGKATATAVTIGASDITTTVAGAFDAGIVATTNLTATSLTVTASYYGETIFVNTNAATTVTLPAAGATAGSWFTCIVVGSDACVPTYAAAAVNTLITVNNQAADSVTYGSGHRIGATTKFISNGTLWIAINVGSTTMTVTDA